MWILSSLEVMGMITKSTTKKYPKFYHLRISFTIQNLSYSINTVNSNNVVLSGLINLVKMCVWLLDVKTLKL